MNNDAYKDCNTHAHTHTRTQMNRPITCAACEQEIGLADLDTSKCCNDVYYCGRECQKRRWAEHRTVCIRRQPPEDPEPESDRKPKPKLIVPRRKTDQDYQAQREREDRARAETLEWRRGFVQGMATVGPGGVLIQPSLDPAAGLGVFADRDFRAGEAVTAYEGVPVRWEDALKLSRAARSHIRALYPMALALDGLVAGNPATVLAGRGGAAYTNDGTTNGTNNTVFAWDDKKGRDIHDPSDPNARVVFLRALRDIRQGEELKVSYGEDYWN